MNLIQNLLFFWGQRLGGAFALMLGLLVLITAGSVWQARQQLQSIAEFDEHTLPAIKLVHLFSQRVDSVRGLEALHVLLDNDTDAQALAQQVARERQQANQQLAAYEKSITDATDRRHYDAVKASLMAYWAAQDVLFQIARTIPADPSATERARQQLNGGSQQAFKTLSQAVDAWWAYNEKRATERATQVRSDARTALAWLISLAALAIVLGVTAAVLISRSITGPLAEATRLADAVGAGELTQRLRAVRRDEIGQLLLNAAVEAARAGSTIDQVLGQMRQVSALITEITAASGEQHTGVGQINSAIGQLDRPPGKTPRG